MAVLIPLAASAAKASTAPASTTAFVNPEEPLANGRTTKLRSNNPAISPNNPCSAIKRVYST